MLFFRAIPFSFAILWRFVLVLPVLLAALTVFTGIAIVATIVAAFVSPLFAALITVAAAFAATVIPVMVGMRVGLQAKRIKARNNYFGLMIPALAYGVFEGLCILILLMIGMGIFLVATPLTVADFTNVQSGGEDAFVSALYAVNGPLTIVLAVIGLLLSGALRTALLVPFAGASIGSDPDGTAHTPFMGFGAGFGPNFLLVILSYIGTAIVLPLTFWITIQLGLADEIAANMMLMSQASSFSDLANISPQLAIAGGIALFCYLFFFSLQCAGAVLVFAGHHGAVKARHKAYDAEAVAQEQAARAPHMEETDLKELLRSRMPNKRY